MRDIARSDSVRGGLSQLKRIFRKASFLYKGGFSGFILVSTSFFSIFPALPPIQSEQIIFQESQNKAAPVSVKNQELSKDELCLWQKDVSLFESLEEDNKKTLLQREIPCVEQEKEIALQVNSKNEDLNAVIKEMAEGYPLEAMSSAISEYDREVAGLIVGIAKKESNWGKRVPRTPEGDDCFNYWGYKGAGTRGVAMGHGCFGSPEEAVHAVGNRLTKLVELRKTSEPKNMVIWKCGSSCATHSPESVKKWISDVDVYYQKIARK